jgi:hypothetical protein
MAAMAGEEDEGIMAANMAYEAADTILNWK